jgi:Rrf2 family transcriptional regulator, nitric oxide-sensitive transcriptional repressor
MMSQTVEYALRAAVCLAAGRGRLLTTAELARRARVPAGYLAKVMQALVRAGLVRSRRGKGGGFTLAANPGALTVLAVVSAVDPIRRLPVCPLGHPAHAGDLCPLHRRLDDAAASVERAFAATSIASLLEGTSQSVPLCLPPPGEMVAAPVTLLVTAERAAGRAPTRRRPRRRPR